MQVLGQEQKAELGSSQYLLRRFCATGLGYWWLDGERSAWLLTSGLFALILLNLGISYEVNVWNRTIFDALQQRDSTTVLLQAIIYFPLMAISVGLGVLGVYARMTMQRLWRAWFNRRSLDRWLTNSRFYQLNLVKGDHANPEYRLAEDLRLATEAPIDFAAGVISAFLSAVTFIFVLWTIGGALSFDVAGATVTIPGFLVIAAVIYAVLASGTMVFIGRRFIAVSERKNQAEAEYRYTLTRLRENAESVTLMGGEDEERRTLDESFGAVLDRWRDICIQAVRSAVVSQTSGYLAAVLPILLCAPKFLDGSMTLGQIMQAAAAFGVVQTAFNWLVDNYPRLADWSASARRVASLMISIDMLERTESGKGALRIRHSETDRAAVRLCNLSVTLDDNRLVVKDVDVTIARGECVIVVGQSGTGKSSLVRAIGGQWPWGKGEVQLQRGAKMCVVPQRPYIPLGTLLRAAAYPMPAEEVDREEVAKIMKAVGLGHLIDRLDEDSPWEQTLSGGEKQRLAFARLLIARPDIVVMDESTSALDPLSQKHLMELIHKRLRAATIIGVGHRPELEGFYERKLVLEPRHDGARLTRDVALTRLAALASRRDILVKFDRSLPACSGVSYQSAASARPSTSAIGR